VKVKFTLEQATKVQRGSRGSYTLSLTSALDGGWVVNATPGPRNPRYLCPVLTKFGIYRLILMSSISTLGQSVQWEPNWNTRWDIQTDRHVEAKRRFPRLYENC